MDCINMWMSVCRCFGGDRVVSDCVLWAQDRTPPGVFRFNNHTTLNVSFKFAYILILRPPTLTHSLWTKNKVLNLSLAPSSAPLLVIMLGYSEEGAHQGWTNLNGSRLAIVWDDVPSIGCPFHSPCLLILFRCGLRLICEHELRQPSYSDLSFRENPESDLNWKFPSLRVNFSHNLIRLISANAKRLIPARFGEFSSCYAYSFGEGVKEGMLGKFNDSNGGFLAG